MKITLIIIFAALSTFTGHLWAQGGGGAPSFTIAQTISDQAQRTTLGFSGLAMITGNLDAQSFFPPGKVADYTGFQYLRDNDPDNMGHNTSFLTRVANNVIYLLNDSQFNQLKTLATAQLEQINLYGYMRFPLMKAFRRLLEGDIPTGSTGLNMNAVKQASRELYIIDGQISFDRALLYANIIHSLDSTQRAALDAMKGRGWNSWPDITNDQIKTKMQGLPQGTAVAVMTYASDLFSWYAGSIEADVYFCPERQGTYYGGFYIKDAPAIGHEGYSINEQLTATAGAALCDSTKGYVTPVQAALMSSLVHTQRNNLYAGTTNIVAVRTQIATLLRSLLVSTDSSTAVRTQVLELSGIYGDLDGENNHAYATIFAQVYDTLTNDQKTQLAALRRSIMSGTYTNGTPFDYSVCTTPFLYSAAITDESVLEPYISDTDYFFTIPPQITIGPTVNNAMLSVSNHYVVVAGETNIFSVVTTNLSGQNMSYQWDFGDGSISPWSPLAGASHVYDSTTCGTHQVSITVSDGISTANSNLALMVACELNVIQLRTHVNFARLSNDTCWVKATLDLAGKTPTNQTLLINVGGAERSFQLGKRPYGTASVIDSRGRALNAGSCHLSYNKRASLWTLTATLTRGNWRATWDTYGMTNATITHPGVPIRLPGVLVIGSEAFAAEPLLTFTAAAGKSGTAKH